MAEADTVQMIPAIKKAASTKSLHGKFGPIGQEEWGIYWLQKG